jgi:hypothetical protein
MRRLRTRTLTVLLITVAALGLTAAAVYASSHHSKAPDGRKHHGPNRHHHNGKGNLGFPPNVNRLDLSGYKIEAKYTLGRNTGNTFDQTYSTPTVVQGVPVEGPFVGTVFPPAKYVALPIAHKTIYIAWLDDSNAIIDAFVMNFRTGVVFDYAPGSASPESSGTVKILTKGANRIP